MQISLSSRISRRPAPDGPASYCRSRNAASPIRNCQNRRMALDLLRKGRANSGLEMRRLGRHAARLPVLRRANRQSSWPRQMQQMSSSFQGPPVLAWRAARDRTQHPKHQEISRPLHVNPRAAIVSSQLGALIGAGFELPACKVLMSVAGHFRPSQESNWTKLRLQLSASGHRLRRSSVR